MKPGNKNIFIERSINGSIDFFKEAIFSEEIARSKGLLQSLDARIKLALLIVFLLTVCLAQNIYFLAALYLFSIVLAAISGINVLFFIKRVWFFIPLFTLVIAIPAIFIQGLFSASIFVLRVVTSVSFVILVTITTKHDRLLKSIRSLGVPAIFVQVIDMSYRYIFVFISAFQEMHLSLKSRLVRRLSPWQARSWIASRISFLFRRSMRMGEEVYLAMVARGYRGDIKKYGK